MTFPASTIAAMSLLLATVGLAQAAPGPSSLTATAALLPGGGELWRGQPGSAEGFVGSWPTGEGVFRVELTVRWLDPTARLTLKAEARTLLDDGLRPDPWSNEARLTYTVAVRTPRLPDGATVVMGAEEARSWKWNERLELEFLGAPVELTAITLTPAPEAPVVFLLGDSTVAEQPEEPWIGWGQMLPRWFAPTVAIANHAKSGAALRSFRAESRLAKVLATAKPGDFALIQFGHNDQKERGEGIGPWTSYAADLRAYIAELRAAGVTPIVLTSVSRRRFDREGRQFASLGDFPAAARAVATELATPLVDLNHLSAVLYAALGPEDSKRAFVHYPADTFPNQPKALTDDSHFNAYGGYELSKAVVQSLRHACPPLAGYLRPNLPPYDPTQPAPWAEFRLPPSPAGALATPAGS